MLQTKQTLLNFKNVDFFLTGNKEQIGARMEINADDDTIDALRNYITKFDNLYSVPDENNSYEVRALAMNTF